ncbi:MAG: chorismate-binding protein [Betaproteobacteria bacterium]|uniref:Chorismate-binding protein n=1 Tax=Candidatus Proximibacter danicus TaxID=2954365 RepID=A0A9D7K3E2_9PROT|nr:chorismate-binding protein [Candidatus Proximibacter danicus]
MARLPACTKDPGDADHPRTGGKPRGLYTGAIGWLGERGDFSLNVAIRTLQVDLHWPGGEWGWWQWHRLGSGASRRICRNVVSRQGFAACVPTPPGRSRRCVSCRRRVSGAAPASRPVCCIRRRIGLYG